MPFEALDRVAPRHDPDARIEEGRDPGDQRVARYERRGVRKHHDVGPCASDLVVEDGDLADVRLIAGEHDGARASRIERPLRQGPRRIGTAVERHDRGPSSRRVVEGHQVVDLGLDHRRFVVGRDDDGNRRVRPARPVRSRRAAGPPRQHMDERRIPEVVIGDQPDSRPEHELSHGACHFGRRRAPGIASPFARPDYHMHRPAISGTPNFVETGPDLSPAAPCRLARHRASRPVPAGSTRA